MAQADSLLSSVADVDLLAKALGAKTISRWLGTPLGTDYVRAHTSLVCPLRFHKQPRTLTVSCDALCPDCYIRSTFPDAAAPYSVLSPQRGHIARATLEATCFQTKAILKSMEKDSGKALTELAVDGGMCNSETSSSPRP